MSGLCTDLYELRMAASYLRRGMVGPATFSLYVRRLPATRGFLVAAGLADALDFLSGFRFTPDELGYLRDVVGLAASDLVRLRDLRFTGDVRAVPEGRVVFADEPLLEVTAPVAQAQLVETVLLNIVTFQTTVASKAARCRLAAGGADLIDFAYRRTQGPAAADAVARASAVVGFHGTSNVAAARRYGLVASGTMAHSFVEAFEDEATAFRAFATDHPGNAVFLVDTYDTLAGVRTAARVVRDLGLTGPVGVRLDSGDLAALSVAARRELDAAGLRRARIVVSGGLDEHDIAALVARGAPVDAYGVGTRMGVSADAPSLDSAYKLVRYGDRPVMKLSAGKATLPGAKQVFRPPDGGTDLLALADEPGPRGWEALLVPVMRAGRRLERPDPPEAVARAAGRFEADLARLPPRVREVADPVPLAPAISDALTGLRDRLAAALAVR